MNQLVVLEDKVEEASTTPSNGLIKKQEEEGVTYPGPFKLTFIMLSLSLTVFLCGLVRFLFHSLCSHSVDGHTC